MRVLLFLWVVAVVALSMAPLAVKERLHTIGRLHYIGHFCIFVLTAGAVLWRTFPLRSQISRAGVVVLLGVALEAAEAIAYRNRFEKRDLLVDVAGVAAGFLATRAVSNFQLRTRMPVHLRRAD